MSHKLIKKRSSSYQTGREQASIKSRRSRDKLIKNRPFKRVITEGKIVDFQNASRIDMSSSDAFPTSNGVLSQSNTRPRPNLNGVNFPKDGASSTRVAHLRYRPSYRILALRESIRRVCKSTFTTLFGTPRTRSLERYPPISNPINPQNRRRPFLPGTQRLRATKNTPTPAVHRAADRFVQKFHGSGPKRLRKESQTTSMFLYGTDRSNSST